MITLGPRPPDNLLGKLLRLGSALAREDRPLDRLAAPIRRPIDRAWYRHRGKLRELGELGDSVGETPILATGKRVLLLSLRMWTDHTAYESVIAQALRLRGAEVVMLTCGGGQPICELGWGRRVAPRPCDRCAYFTDRVAARGGLRLMRLADEFPWGASPRRAPIEPDESGRLSPPDSARASVAWFTNSVDNEGLPAGAAIERDFSVSVGAVEAAMERILDRVRPDVVFALNGLFAADRAVRAVAADRGVRVVTYEIAPRKGALVFGEKGAAPEMVMEGLAEDQCSRPLSSAEENALDAMLLARVTGAASHEVYFHGAQEHDGDAVRRSLGIAADTRVISAFTNLAWDTALFGKDIAYESQFDWLADAAQIVAARDDAVLVVRAHPAESRWGTEQPAIAELSARLGGLPRNVIPIRSDDPLSSYGLLAITDLVLAYTTTIGLEAALQGVPVAVAGDTHYRGRGFTIDIDSPEDLVQAIAGTPAMSADQVELARRYAFAFFFRLMIPFNLVRNIDGRLAVVPVSAEDLLPGSDRYLDFVCDRILDGGEFFLPPELALETS